MTDENKSKAELIAEIQKLRLENRQLKQSVSPPPQPFANLSGSETILVVDDNEDTRAVVAAMLEDLKYTTIDTGSSEKAQEIFALRKDDIDLVLTDIVMPDISGPEMVEEMQEQKPGLKVVFMSGYAEGELVHTDVFKVQHSEATFIKKPFSLKDIGTIIRGRLDA